jgi:hypothetical protein
MGLTFEWTVKFGDALTAGSMLVGALIVAGTVLYKRGGQEVGAKLTLEALTKQLEEMKTEFKAFSAALREVAVQRSQIDLLMKWYDELRRGVGKIE